MKTERNTGFKPAPSEWESEMLITNTNFAMTGNYKIFHPLNILNIKCCKFPFNKYKYELISQKTGDQYVFNLKD